VGVGSGGEKQAKRTNGVAGPRGGFGNQRRGLIEMTTPKQGFTEGGEQRERWERTGCSTVSATPVTRKNQIFPVGTGGARSRKKIVEKQAQGGGGKTEEKGEFGMEKAEEPSWWSVKMNDPG